MKKRIVFFAHYDKNGIIDDYVVYFIKELKKICQDLIFVSVSNVSEKEQIKLNGLANAFINKKNEGYDFGSWKSGIESIGFENLSKYDEIVLVNDSCYGPIFDIKKVFEKMDKKEDLGVWSITKGESIAKYLQSYLLVLRKNVFEKQFFIDFFATVSHRGTKIEYIKDFEIGLSSLIIENNIKFDSYCNVSFIKTLIQGTILKIKTILLKTFSDRHRKWHDSFGKQKRTKIEFIKLLLNPRVSNPSLIMIPMMIKKYKIPLIKIMLFRDNPYCENVEKTKKYIKKYTNYDFSLIENHLKRTKE